MITKQLKSFLFAMCALVLCAASASAGSVTYSFIEDTDSPNPGTVGAFFVFASPPASATSAWTIDDVTQDILDFEITDPKIGPVGSYLTINSSFGLVSASGTSLDTGIYAASNAAGNSVFITVAPGVHGAGVSGADSTRFGQFVLAPVPEPSSLLLADMAALVGLGLWMRRRKR